MRSVAFEGEGNSAPRQGLRVRAPNSCGHRTALDHILLFAF